MRQKRQNPPVPYELGNFEFPEAGGPAPSIGAPVQVKGPNMVWHGDLPGRRDPWLRCPRWWDRGGFLVGFVVSVVLGLLCWAALIFCILTLSGCAGGKGFTRAGFEHYGTQAETDYSAVATVVGRYFVLVEDKVNAELTSGAWYGIHEDRTYGLVGGAISWKTDDNVSLGAGLKFFLLEDTDDVEVLGSVTVEVPWP